MLPYGTGIGRLMTEEALGESFPAAVPATGKPSPSVAPCATAQGDDSDAADPESVDPLASVEVDDTDAFARAAAAARFRNTSRLVSCGSSSTMYDNGIWPLKALY